MKHTNTARTPRLVVTLSGEGGRELVRLARARGWEAVQHVGLSFTPLPDTAGRLRDLNDVVWLLLTSPYAARRLVAELKGAGLGAAHLAGVRVGAVGRGTATPLAEWGRAADFIPAQAGARELAAELPAEAGTLALHVTGEASRDTLQRGLKARGVCYERLDLYRTQAPTYSAQALADLRAADWVVLASGVAARGIAAQAGRLEGRAVVMGEQTAQATAEAGFTRVLQAQQPSLEGLLDAVAEAE